MAVDISISPWNRLVRLAPPGTNTVDLQAAADRYALTADVYAAAADLWEEAAMMIDITPDDTTEPLPLDKREIRSISQDGISVTYAGDGMIGNGFSANVSSASQMMKRARYFRSKAKGKSVLVHDAEYDPWKNRGRTELDPDIIIPVNEVTEL